jgi:hypothetical protein
MEFKRDEHSNFIFVLSMDELRDINPKFANIVIKDIKNEVHDAFFYAGSKYFKSADDEDRGWEVAVKQIESLPMMEICYEASESSDFYMCVEGAEITYPRSDDSVSTDVFAYIGDYETEKPEYKEMYDCFRAKFEEEMKKRYPELVRCTDEGFYYVADGDAKS